MKALIVDDNRENRYMLEFLLKQNSHQVETAIDGADALVKARREPPDIVISDILMPKMDGFALCRAWKTDEALKAIPFVFYTATYTDEKDRKFALDLGAERFIVKPAEPDVFMQEIEEVLMEKQSGELSLTRESFSEEETYLRQHNEALVRKLQDKIDALQLSNDALSKEITERKRTEERLRDSLQEKQKLLQELYHRTRNNMQVIRSLLSLQARAMQSEEVRELVKCTENRIQSMALVHQLLKESNNLSHVDFRLYVHELYQLLRDSYSVEPGLITLEPDLDPIRLLIDTAVPLGLILTELLSHSLQQAAAKENEHRISIHLSRPADNRIELIYADDAFDLPADFDSENDPELGLNIVFSLARHQLQAEVDLNTEKGMQVQFQFRDDLYLQRV